MLRGASGRLCGLWLAGGQVLTQALLLCVVFVWPQEKVAKVAKRKENKKDLE